MLISPLVIHLSWGAIQAEGLGTLRDVKLWPGGGREWDWSETGTHHSPGIQVADVLELVQHGAKSVVLSQGMERRLQTCPETLDFLRDAGIDYHVAETLAAVERYNSLVQSGELVGALFHSTC